MIPADSAVTRHGSRMLPWRTLLLTGLALGFFLSFGAAPEAWVFDRSAIGQGEWWRLITGHWVHSDLEHAAWDIGALLVLGLLFESRLRGKLFGALALGTLGIDLWLWHAAPSISYYCGLSGILNGLLALGLWRLWQETRHPVVWLTGFGAVAKILWETWLGGALLTTTAWPSLPEVHGVGFVCGLIFAVSAQLLKQCMAEQGQAGARQGSVRLVAPLKSSSWFWWGVTPPYTKNLSKSPTE